MLATEEHLSFIKVRFAEMTTNRRTKINSAFLFLPDITCHTASPSWDIHNAVFNRRARLVHPVAKIVSVAEKGSWKISDDEKS